MGRREDRDWLESSWTVLEPRVPGTPFTKKDIDDSVVIRATPGIREDSPDLARLRRILK